MEESVEAEEKGEKTGGRNPKMTAHQAQTPPHTLLDPRSAPPRVGSALLQEGPGGCCLVSTGTDPGLQKCPIDGSFYSPARPPPLQACERDSPPVVPLLEACAHRPGHHSPPPLTTTDRQSLCQGKTRLCGRPRAGRLWWLSQQKPP